MPLTLRVLLGLVLGLAIGAALSATGYTQLEQVIAVSEPLGGLWLDALRMTIIPLVFSLIVVGMIQARGAAGAGGPAARALSLFAILLTAAAAFSALVMPAVLAAWPVSADAAAGLRAAVASSTAPFVADAPRAGEWIRGFLPANPIKAAADGAMAPLVIFAVLFALAASRIAHELQDRLTGVFEAVSQAMLVLVGWVLWLGPIGVFALGLGVGARAGAGAVGVLGHYVLIISGVCIAVALLQYPLALLLARRSPLAFARAVAPAQIVAFSTQSSIASLPAMLEGTRALGVSNRTAGVVLPLAVSLFRITSPAANLAVAIYVAHINGVALGPGQLVLGVAIAAIVSLAAVGLPGQTTFFTTIVPICLAMGVPMELLPILLAVETIPDIFRTVGNVTADVAVSVIVEGRGPAGEAEPPVASPA